MLNLQTLTNKSIFDELFEDFMNFPKLTSYNGMPTDIKETRNAYELSVELPGYDKNDIKVSLKEGNLIITAERKQSETKNNNDYIKKERYYGIMKREFYVGDIDETKLTAKLENGVLNINIPKEAKKEKENLIEIK